MRLIWWLATVAAVGIVAVVLSEQRALDPLQNLSLSASAPVESGLRDIASPLNDIYDGIADRGALVRENRRLQEELESLKNQLAGQQEAQQRIQELEAALQVKQGRPQDQLLVANVIAVEPSGLKRAIAIDRGQDDGVDEGMVVLSRNGTLVGTVSRAYRDFAWVRLITDPDSAVNAEVSAPAVQPPQQTPAPSTPTPSVSQPSAAPHDGQPAGPTRGVAEGDLRDGLVLDLLPTEANVGQGNLVITSGLGGNYPPALLIGSIQEVAESPQSPFKSATVDPAADLSGLDTVLVLVSFRPARLNGP